MIFPFLSSCLAQSTPEYLYPTKANQEVRTICSQVYAPENAFHIAGSRKSHISRFDAYGDEVVAYFANGREAVVPITTNLPYGSTHYCGTNQNKSYP